MSRAMGKEVAALQRMSVKELRARYAELFDDETRTGNKVWLVKRIAWRMQALDEGGLSERARARAEELANEADLRLSPPKGNRLAGSLPTATIPLSSQRDPRLPIPGTIITRDYKGRRLQVHVLDSGFEYDGEFYKSLSAVAKAITGSHANGYHFFGLRKGDQP